jgi:DNA-directed RNA polymerase specialized sigma24 family protein
MKEISVITGMPENTVKSHLSRARGNLSNHLNKIGYER